MTAFAARDGGCFEVAGLDGRTVALAIQLGHTFAPVRFDAEDAPKLAAAILAAAGRDDLAELVEPPAPDLSAYKSPCPEGYDTVLHWRMRQGQEPEDMGRKDGLRLWRLTSPGGQRCDVLAIKVRAPLALTEADVCEWVLAYPEDFLREHLGDAP